VTPSATIDFPTQSSPKQKSRLRRTEAQWKALLEEYATSGLTQAAFCQKHHIASSGLYKWRKHFARQSAESNFIDITESLGKATAPFSEPGRDGHWQVELELGPGVILRVRAV
jgi:transposase-like protein